MGFEDIQLAILSTFCFLGDNFWRIFFLKILQTSGHKLKSNPRYFDRSEWSIRDGSINQCSQESQHLSLSNWNNKSPDSDCLPSSIFIRPSFRKQNIFRCPISQKTKIDRVCGKERENRQQIYIKSVCLLISGGKVSKRERKIQKIVCQESKETENGISYSKSTIFKKKTENFPNESGFLLNLYFRSDRCFK